MNVTNVLEAKEAVRETWRSNIISTYTERIRTRSRNNEWGICRYHGLVPKQIRREDMIVARSIGQPCL